MIVVVWSLRLRLMILLSLALLSCLFIQDQKNPRKICRDQDMCLTG
jgi:hypothetical protein